jgi:hypothetical protein
VVLTDPLAPAGVKRNAPMAGRVRGNLRRVDCFGFPNRRLWQPPETRCILQHTQRSIQTPCRL